MIRSRLILQLLAGLTLTAVCSVVWAQPAEPPTLPETRVEATPPTTDYFAPQEMPSGLTGTILDGTLFSNVPFRGYRAPTTTSGSIIAMPDAVMPQTVGVLS